MARILLLTPQLPYPPHQGTSLRNFHIIRGLASGHDLTLLSFLEQGQSADLAAIAPLLECLIGLHTVPVPPRGPGTRLLRLLTDRGPDMAHRLLSPEFDGLLSRLLQQTPPFDVVQIEGIELARTLPIIRRLSPASKVVFDDHNAETELQRRAFQTDLPNPRRWPAAAYSWIQSRRLSRFERWICDQADAVTVVSEADKGHLQALLPGLQPEVIPNCIDVTRYRPEATDEAIAFDLLFSGKMDYRPNIDAVLWFARDIWPLIRRRRPETTWAVVGQKPHPRLDWLRELPGVTVTGWVEAVQPYLKGAAVYIMPFRLGSGTRLKLIEAMAAGKALVSTPTGAEGFGASDGQELLLAEEPAEFAAAVLSLLDSSRRRAEMGRAARHFAAGYDWRQIIPRFEKLYQRLDG